MDNAIASSRQAAYPASQMFLDRWSPRALSGETLTDDELLPLFEAARWAPSSYNNQPWRFIVARRDTPEWEKLFNLLGDFNKSWCRAAAVLVVVISVTKFDFNGQGSRTHSFDAGAAWENLALEASARGLVAHGMEGFDYDRAKSELRVPEEYTVEAMLAIGQPGKIEDLPADLQEREKPSDRKQLKELVFKGIFGEQYLS